MPPTAPQYRHSPYRFSSFVKYRIRSFSPASGIIEAAAGDTLAISLELEDMEYAKRIAPGAFFDSTLLVPSPHTVFLSPKMKEGRAVYSFVVRNQTEWINLLFNNDLVLRYRLKRKDAKKESGSFSWENFYLFNR
jgi:hypothetical protein